jgi:hypothetical protein
MDKVLKKERGSIRQSSEVFREERKTNFREDCRWMKVAQDKCPMEEFLMNNAEPRVPLKTLANIIIRLQIIKHLSV